MKTDVFHGFCNQARTSILAEVEEETSAKTLGETMPCLSEREARHSHMCKSLRELRANQMTEKSDEEAPIIYF